MNFIKAAFATSMLGLATTANATVFTMTSPTYGTLPSGVSEVGGLVLDLTGSNGSRIVSQLAASDLYVGFSESNNPLIIGTQTGFDSSVHGSLGGGLSSATIRMTLYDGDSSPGNFDQGTDNTFMLNGYSFGYFGDVNTEMTSDDGLTSYGFTTGFTNNKTNTGFFTSTDAGMLSSLYSSIVATEAVEYSLFDIDPNDNFYDFTRGVDSSLINIGQGPVVTPPVSAIPEPSTYALMLGGLGLVGFMARRRKQA